MKQKLKLVPYPALVRESGGVCPPARQGNVTGHVGELPGGPEAYELDITPDGIQMTGSPAGILYSRTADSCWTAAVISFQSRM